MVESRFALPLAFSQSVKRLCRDFLSQTAWLTHPQHAGMGGRAGARAAAQSEGSSASLRNSVEADLACFLYSW